MIYFITNVSNHFWEFLKELLVVVGVLLSGGGVAVAAFTRRKRAKDTKMFKTLEADSLVYREVEQITQTIKDLEIASIGVCFDHDHPIQSKVIESNHKKTIDLFGEPFRMEPSLRNVHILINEKGIAHWNANMLSDPETEVWYNANNIKLTYGVFIGIGNFYIEGKLQEVQLTLYANFTSQYPISKADLFELWACVGRLRKIYDNICVGNFITRV